jgi:hypothetical protein
VRLLISVRLPVAGLDFQREVTINANEPIVYFTETVHNLRKADHFFHWTQHVTLGGTFLDPQATTVSIPGQRSVTFPHDEGEALLVRNQEFTWPHAPLLGGGTIDLTKTLVRTGRGFVVAVLLKKEKDLAFIAAVNRELGLLIAYCFKRTDFPWVAVWEENLGIPAPPWNGKTQARGLEFSTTPLPVTRREAFMSGHVLGEPTHTVVPALQQRNVKYIALLAKVPDSFLQLRDVEIENDRVVLVGDASSEPVSINAPGIRSHFN